MHVCRFDSATVAERHSGSMPCKGNVSIQKARRHHMTPVEMQEKAIQIFGQGLQ